jgi:hypothetical protein
MNAELPAITWTQSFEDALTRARAEQKAVLLDFTAAPM